MRRFIESFQLRLYGPTAMASTPRATWAATASDSTVTSQWLA